MGLWGSVAGLFTSKKNSETVVDTAAGVVNGIKNGIDALVLTDEERITYTQKGVEQFLTFMDKVAGENTEQSKARRELARMTFKVYFSLVLMAVAVRGLDKEYAMFILGLLKELFWLMSAVATLYFGPYQIAKVWSKKPEK